MDVVAENGIPFRAVVLTDGKSENFVTKSMGDRSMIEFYDLRFMHTPDGQFTGGRYYLESVLDQGRGLIFDGGVPAWQIDSRTWDTIRKWLSFLVDRGLFVV
jgi:hypothetical protein